MKYLLPLIFITATVVTPAGLYAQQPDSNNSLEQTTNEAADSEKPSPEDQQTNAATPAANDDFKPSEEISEDFPVPLPSDI